MKNKYEDIEMIDLEDKYDDIIDIYLEEIKSTNKSVGIIVSKEFAEYIMEEFVRFSWTSIKEIDMFDAMDINEYIVGIDKDGNITCVPIAYFDLLCNYDVLYIDMDGDIKQSVINHCVNDDKKLILFGQEDNYDGCDNKCNCGCENCSYMSDADDTYVHLSDGDDGNTHGFTASKSDGDSYVSYSYYTSEELSQSDIEKMLKAFGF